MTAPNSASVRPAKRQRRGPTEEEQSVRYWPTLKGLQALAGVVMPEPPIPPRHLESCS